jgi:hypothetical protein
VSKVRRLVLDVLKPHQPTMLTLADKLGDIEGIKGVDIALFEIDNKVENIKITLEGDDIDYQEVQEVIHRQRTDRRSGDAARRRRPLDALGGRVLICL